MLKRYYMTVKGDEKDIQALWHSILRMPFHKKDYEEDFGALWFKGMRSDWFPCMLMGRYGHFKYEGNMIEAEQVKSVFKHFTNNLKYQSFYLDNANVKKDEIGIYFRCKENHNQYDILEILKCYGLNQYYVQELK